VGGINESKIRNNYKGQKKIRQLLKTNERLGLIGKT
jgi:hypothetical protein